MKKYEVTNSIRNAAQIAGIEPYDTTRENLVEDYVEAETAAEAIELVVDILCEQINSNGFKFERTSDGIIVCDDGENKIQEYYNFQAVECTEEFGYC